MASDAADELESLANAALLLALQALLGGRDAGATKSGVAAGKAMDRLLLSGMRAFDAAGSRDAEGVRRTVANNDSFENGADATVRTLKCSLEIGMRDCVVRQVWRVHRYDPNGCGRRSTTRCV